MIFHIISTILILSFSTLSWQYMHIPLNIGPDLPFQLINASFNSSGLGARFENYSEFINEVGAEPYQGYFLSLYIGTPQQQINALLDTGSSSFAIAGHLFPGLKRYFEASRSKTFSSFHKYSSVKYTQGEWSGVLGSDMVSLLSEAVIINGSFASKVPPVRIPFARITAANNFFVPSSNWEGIVGLSFDKLGDPYEDNPVTFYTALVNSLKMKDVFSTLFCGLTARSLKHALSEGEFENMSRSVFIAGGIDEELYKGKLVYTPVVQAQYFDIVLTNLTINGKAVHEDCKELNFDKVIVDTGTTNIRLPKRVFKNAITLLKRHIKSQISMPFTMEESFWTRHTLLCIPVEESAGKKGLVGDSPYIYFPDVVFTVMAGPSTTIDITISPQQYLSYIGPRSDFTGFGQRNCFVLGIQESDFGTMIGSVFLEGFYVVFDRENSRVGWGQSTCNRYTLSKRVSVSRVSETSSAFSAYHLKLSNEKVVTISKPVDCAYKDPFSFDRLRFLSNLATLIMTLFGFIFLILLVIFLCFLHFSDFTRSESLRDSSITSDSKEIATDDKASLSTNEVH